MSILSKIRDVNNFNVGGGAASALAGAQAAGMIGMVSNLSIGKEYGLSDDEYKGYVERLEILSQALMEGAEADEVAFMKIRNAYRLPKTTDFEKAIRHNAIQYGFVSAANTPLANAKLCLEVFQIGRDLLAVSNPNAKTDLEIAVALSEIGWKGCIANVDANLGMIKDADIVAGFTAQINKLKGE